MALEIKKITFFRAPKLTAIATFSMVPVTLILQQVFHQPYLCMLEDGEKQDEHLYLAD